MPKDWKEWEGRVLNGDLRLGEYLGGSEHAGVFLTEHGPESRKAAIKLIPVKTWDQATAEGELSRLHSARELSHPHLLQIYQAGRAKLDDTELLFVVMEHAEEDLSQILPNRPLSAAEVREILKPTLDALGYLHGKGFVHGHLKPANVMAIGDQLKLSSDGISRLGERRGALGERSDYDAPEIAQGENSAASDVWSLGMLLVMALTQRLPDWSASGETPIVPDNVPPPFDEIARHCLLRDARARLSLADVAARMGFGTPTKPAVPKQELRQGAVTSVAAAGPRLAVPQRKAVAGPPKFTAKRRSNAGAYLAVGVALAIVGIFVVPRLFRGGTIESKTIHSQTNSPAQAPARANRVIAQVSDPGEGDGAPSKTNPPVAGEKPEDLSEVRAKAPRRGLTAGQVAEQVLPDVPTSASESIHGTVRVGVRVSVDSSGNVTEADLDSPGPSKYFAHLALEAAQQWKFDPPKMQGRNVLSDWLLHFQFTQKGTKVIPVQSAP
jgi:eukaryotic-like serine/threonine-protein kinase